TVLAPDLMRTNTEVNLYLQADDMSSPVLVQITIQDYRKSITLLQDSVTLNSGNSFYTLKPIKLSSSHFDHEEKKDNYVYLKVNFQGFHIEERMIMVSLQTGYIFIQTDKPVYNPGNIVHFRTFVSSPYFKAIDESITIEVQNSEGLVVKQLLRYRAVDAIYSDIFTLSEFANEGTWKVTAKFDNWQQNTFSTQFQVKKFVLPAFNVTLIPRKTSISLEDSQLEVEVEARYLYGKPVKGTAYVLFGVQINNERARLPTMKRVTDVSLPPPPH
uniref:Macroglobulin domain-containing protein n=1 Tax=Echeneis naucrates TaxID=173247 RepID=A0A665VT32_ECHNA